MRHLMADHIADMASCLEWLQSCRQHQTCPVCVCALLHDSLTTLSLLHVPTPDTCQRNKLNPVSWTSHCNMRHLTVVLQDEVGKTSHQDQCNKFFTYRFDSTPKLKKASTMWKVETDMSLLCASDYTVSTQTGSKRWSWDSGVTRQQRPALFYLPSSPSKRRFFSAEARAHTSLSGFATSHRLHFLIARKSTLWICV